MVQYMKWLILDLLDVVWRKYDIHVFPSCHHKRYVGRNLLHGLLVKSFSFLIFFLLCLKWLQVVILPLQARPNWCIGASHCFNVVLDFERCFLVRKLYQKIGGHMLTPKIGTHQVCWTIWADRSDLSWKPVRSVKTSLSYCKLDFTIAQISSRLSKCIYRTSNLDSG